MLHQENSDVFVRHHSEQLACGNLREMDDGRSNFLPEKYHIATGNDWPHVLCLIQASLDPYTRLSASKVCPKDDKVGQFDEELLPNVGFSEWNASVSPVNTMMVNGVKEVTVDHNKRPATNDMPDTVEFKRIKQENQSKNIDNLQPFPSCTLLSSMEVGI